MKVKKENACDFLSQRGDPNPELVKLEAIMRAMNEKYKAHSSLLVHRVFVPKSGKINRFSNDSAIISLCHHACLYKNKL